MPDVARRVPSRHSHCASTFHSLNCDCLCFPGWLHAMGEAPDARVTVVLTACTRAGDDPFRHCRPNAQVSATSRQHDCLFETYFLKNSMSSICVLAKCHVKSCRLMNRLRSTPEFQQAHESLVPDTNRVHELLYCTLKASCVASGAPTPGISLASAFRFRTRNQTTSAVNA